MTWVRIAPEALSDLDDYEIQEPDYGDYYASRLRSYIDRLKITAGSLL